MKQVKEGGGLIWDDVIKQPSDQKVEESPLLSAVLDSVKAGDSEVQMNSFSEEEEVINLDVLDLKEGDLVDLGKKDLPDRELKTVALKQEKEKSFGIAELHGDEDDLEDVDLEEVVDWLDEEKSTEANPKIVAPVKAGLSKLGSLTEGDDLEEEEEEVDEIVNEVVEEKKVDATVQQNPVQTQESTSGKGLVQGMRDALFDKSQKPVQVNKIPDFFRHQENFDATIKQQDSEKGSIRPTIDLSSWRTSHGADKQEYGIAKGEREGVYHIQGSGTRFKVDFNAKDGPEILEERLTKEGKESKWVTDTNDGKAANFGYRAERLGMLATAFEGEFEEREIQVVKGSKEVEKVVDVAVEEVEKVKEAPKTLKDSIKDLDSLIQGLEANIEKLGKGEEVTPLEVGKKKGPEIKDQTVDSSETTVNPVIVEAPAGKENKKSGSMLGSMKKFFGLGAKEEEKQEDPQIQALQELMEKWAEAANAKLPEGLSQAEQEEAKVAKISEMKGMVAEIAKERTSAALKNLESEGKIKGGEAKDGVKPKNIEFENPDAAKQFCENYQKACEGLGIECKMTQKEGGGYKLSTPKECAGKDIFNMSKVDLEALKELIEANKEAAKEAAAVKAAAEAAKVTVDMGHDEDDLHKEPEKKIVQTQDLEEQKEETKQEITKILAHELVSGGGLNLDEMKVGDSSVDASSLAGQQKKGGMSLEDL